MEVAFYSGLLTIQVTLVSIICATIFLFIQLGFENIPTSRLARILENWWLKAFFLFEAVAICFTALGWLLLSVPKHDFIPWYDLHSNEFFINPRTLGACLGVSALGLLPFVVFIFKYFPYLHPSRMLLVAFQEFKTRDIERSMLRNYDVIFPDKIKSAQDLSDAELEKLLCDREEVERPEFLRKDAILSHDGTGEEETDLEAESSDLKLKLIQSDRLKLQEKFIKLKAEANLIESPFEILNEITIRAILNRDIKTIESGNKSFSSVTTRFLSTAEKNKEKSAGMSWIPSWKPYVQYLDIFLEGLEAQMEVCDCEVAPYLATRLAQRSNAAWRAYTEVDRPESLRPIYEFWRRHADYAIERNSALFRLLVRFFIDASKDFAGKSHINKTDEIFRDLGWLGERLLGKLGVEQDSRMPSSHSTEFDFLLECILEFGELLEGKHPDEYPLIYFDAILVIQSKLLILLGKDLKNSSIEQAVDSLTMAIERFSINAIDVGNARGAALGCLRLKEIRDEMMKIKLVERGDLILENLVSLGMHAAGRKQALATIDFLGGRIHDWVIKYIAKAGANNVIAGAIQHEYPRIDRDDNHDGVWRFITELGKMMETNFGFMFDWQTSTIYSDDDPRRR